MQDVYLRYLKAQTHQKVELSTCTSILKAQALAFDQ